MAIGSGVGGVLLVVGRVLFGLVMVFNGYNHFANVDAMTGYGEAKSLPAPRASVLVSGGLLVLGGLGIVFGVLPVLSAGALVVFLLTSAVTMHAFWAVPDDQKQGEQTQFVKNVGLAGGALAFLVLGGQAWAFAVNYTLF